MAASTYFAQVQQLYIAYFGRPADTIGQAYWAAQIDAANGSIAAVQAGFSASAESAALFGNKSTIDKVTAIYQNAFGRAPEPAGLAYWANLLDTGKVTQAQASWTIQQSAGAGDAAVVQAKLVAAQAFTAQIDTTAEIQGYQGTGAADAGRAFLATVVSAATGATAVTNAPTALAAAVTAGGTVGTSYVLTAALDNLTGDNGNNTFTGDVATTSAADQVNGGGGIDTFNLVGATAASPVLPTLTNVERLILTNPTVALNANVSAITGLTDVVVKGAVALGGGSITTAAGVTTTVDGSTTSLTIATAATAAAQTVGVTNGTTVGTLTVDGAAVKALTIASNGSAANTITTLDGTAGATAQANSTLNITGSQKLTITNAIDTDFTIVNASANTGGVSVAFGANTVTATGGTGADKFSFGGNLTVADKVDGGAGIDTVSVTGADLTTGANVVLAGLNGVTNVEVVEFTGAAAATVAFGTGGLTNAAVTKVLFNTTGVAADVVNAADAAHTYAFGSANTGAATVNLATGVTTVNVALEGTAGTAGVVGALTVAPTAAELVATPALVSTVNITSTGVAGAPANTVASLVAQAGSTFKVAGSQDLTISALTNKGTVDASAFTGKLAITGSLGADTIILGTGADTVTVGYTAATVGPVVAATAGSTYTALDTITNFAKADTLVLQTLTVNTAANLVKFDATNSVSFEQALISAETSITGAAVASWFNYAGNTYVVANTDTANSATAVGSTDLVVKLTGVQTLTADATGIHGAV